MTPTIEEVKRVADKYGLTGWPDQRFLSAFLLQLNDFAQHYIEVGRKQQRESDAMICDEEADIANNQARNGGSALDDGRAIGAEACAEAIRNNTGE